MQETKEAIVEVKNAYECGLGCHFLRRFDSVLGGKWWCNLYDSKLSLSTDNIIHRHPKCDGTYLFTMKSIPEGPEFTV